MVTEEKIEVITYYTHEEAVAASLEYFDGNQLAADTFVGKYALKDGKGRILERTPADMHRRLAKEFARIEAKKFKTPYTEEFIFSKLAGFKRISAQGSPTYGIGNKSQYVSLSNCYVVPSPLDSYGSILKTDEALVQISKRRGGVGTDLSNLRPAGAFTKNAARTSTGVVSFAHRYSNTIREVGQEGRRGALMLTLDVHHPDILGFTRMKRNATDVTGANISVRLSDRFLTAVEATADYEQAWPVDSTPVMSQKVNAKVVWDTIVENAHFRAEPGLLFWDNIIRDSPADCYADVGFKTICTNPCSEIPLSAYDSCRLMILNAFGYVKSPFTSKAWFDFNDFATDAQVCQRLMDDLVDLELESIDRIIGKIESDPEPADTRANELELWTNIRKAAEDGRRTGTGLTAIGDTLAGLGIAYTSDAGIALVEQIYKTLKLAAYRSSVDMAKELGPFPVWDAVKELNNPFLQRIKAEDPLLFADMQTYGRRNIALLTTAPVGTLSILTQTTAGIEPEFSVEPYTRRKKGNPSDQGFRLDFTDAIGDHWMEFKVYPAKVKMWMDVTGKTDLKESPWHGSTADVLEWPKRVKLQAAAQRHVDHAISSTLNLPKDATVETIDTIYRTAWKSGCKGITVYRDGCRTGVLIKDEPKVTTEAVPPSKRPPELYCGVQHVKAQKDQYFVLISLLKGKPYEIFAGLNSLDGKPIIPKEFKSGVLVKKARGHYQGIFISDDKAVMTVDRLSNLVSSEEGAITRLLSMSLRNGIPVESVVHQLEKVTGDMFSFTKCIARALKKYIPDGVEVAGEVCAACGTANSVVRQEGCLMCRNCGSSKCS